MKKSRLTKILQLVLLQLIVQSSLLFATEVTLNPSLSNPITSTLQGYIDDANITKITIPQRTDGQSWFSGPIFLKSNKEIYFKAGVVFEALPGSIKYYPDKDDDAFFLVRNVENVKFIGENATIKMPIEEYTEGEHRMCISLKGSSNIEVKGLTLYGSGGDGIYLGYWGGHCQNVIIENVICDRNRRQGISIITAKNVSIKNCKLINTGRINGTGPSAGIDIEPNGHLYPEDNVLQNISIEQCTFDNNAGSALQFELQNLTTSAPALSINIKDILIKDSGDHGIRIKNIYSSNQTGYINIDNANVNSSSSEIYFKSISSGSFDIKITNSILHGAISGWDDFWGDLWGTTANSIIDGNGCDMSQYLYHVYILDASRNKARLYHSSTRDFDASGLHTQTIVGNFNSDNKSDLFIKGFAEFRSLFLANGAGNGFSKSFSASEDNIAGTDSEGWLTSPSAKITPGDYDGDGDTDLFVKGYGTYRAMYLSNGDGTFLRKFMSNQDEVGGTDYEGWLTSSDAILYPGDYNGDGNTDIFFKGHGSYFGMYISNGDGTFFRKFLNNISGTGGLDNHSCITSSSANVYPGDYNGDGKTDLLFKGYGTYRAMYLAKSDGSGTFNRVFLSELDDVNGDCGGIDSEVWFTSSDAKVYPGDYNGDGRTDLFAKGWGTARVMYIAKSDNSGKFTRVFMGIDDDVNGSVGGTDSEPFFTSSDAILYPGDYNGDGRTDLFVKGHSTERAMYIAKSDNSGKFTRIFLGTTSDAGGVDCEPFFTSPQAKLFTGDFNGDGRTDLFVKGYQNYSALYHARSDGSGMFWRQFISSSNYDNGVPGAPWFVYNEVDYPENYGSPYLRSVSLLEDSEAETLDNEITTSASVIENESISIYPNPFTNSLNITGQNINIIVIYNSNGQIVYSASYKHVLNLDFLQSGLHMIMLYDKQNELIHTQKILKQ